MKSLMEFGHLDNLQLRYVFFGGTYQLILFWFYIRIFRIMESRCSIFLVTLILFTLQYDIVKIIKEFRNTHH